ncbi:MAG: MBL fold metallo-hydrolase [Coriobacteriales bacterium]|jgi:glyoxylase-like metal-dependent hydrolase (beta-lactamase superfamily II)|nr:MBL fold metallo-hydrolase [Coriobacteriales bacterium]
MRVERVEVQIGPGFIENCYILSDAADATRVTVVDPGAQVEKIRAAVGDRTVERIVLTHRHYDHVGALAQLVQATGAEVVAHTLDAQAISEPAPSRLSPARHATPTGVPVTKTVEDGDIIRVGNTQLSVLYTPGHTIGSICLYDDNDHILIAGDTLFRGAVGRTDLPTGNAAQQRESLRKLAQLPGDTKVHPGHDQDTSIGRELGYLASALEGSGNSGDPDNSEGSANLGNSASPDTSESSSGSDHLGHSDRPHDSEGLSNSNRPSNS